jgi:hypothetical protein
MQKRIFVETAWGAWIYIEDGLIDPRIDPMRFMRIEKVVLDYATLLSCYVVRLARLELENVCTRLDVIV